MSNWKRFEVGAKFGPATVTLTVTTTEFARMFQKERDAILRAQIIPPVLGGDGFGAVRVVKRIGNVDLRPHLEIE